MSTMQEIKVSKASLLDKLKANRDTHLATFRTAQVKYREAVIKELDQHLADARALKKIRRVISMPEPEDHTDDYDMAIEMLGMCVDDELNISVSDFRQLVQDEWGWKRAWKNSTEAYLSA